MRYLAVILAVLVAGCSFEPMPRPLALGPSPAGQEVPLPSGSIVLHGIVVSNGRIGETVIWPFSRASECEAERVHALSLAEKHGQDVKLMRCERIGKGI